MKNLYISILFSLMSLSAWSAPDWQISPTDYEYSMSFTGVVLLNDLEVSSTNGQLSAWINGELRGQAQAQVIPGTNRVYFLLNVYSNSVSQDSISFVYYDADSDNEINLTNDAKFEVLVNRGTYSSPYLFETPPGVQLLSFSIVGHEQEFELTNTNIVNITLRDEADLNALTAEFDFSLAEEVRVNNIPQLSGVNENDFSDTVTYQVLSSAQNGLTNEFKVVVKQGVYVDQIASTELDFEAKIQNDLQYIKLSLLDSTTLSNQELSVDFAHADSVLWNGEKQTNTLTLKGENIVQVDVFQNGHAETWTIEIRQPPYPTKFEFVGHEQTMNFDKTTNTISIKLDESINPNALTANYNFGLVDSVIVDGEKQTSGLSSNNFSVPVIYNVYSGSTVYEYIVLVNAANTNQGLSAIADSYNESTKIFPVPANTFINIATEAGQIAAISLIAMDGNEVLHEEVTDAFVELNVSTITRGIYILRLHYDDGIEVQRKIVLVD